MIPKDEERLTARLTAIAGFCRTQSPKIPIGGNIAGPIGAFRNMATRAKNIIMLDSQERTLKALKATATIKKAMRLNIAGSSVLNKYSNIHTYVGFCVTGGIIPVTSVIAVTTRSQTENIHLGFLVDIFFTCVLVRLTRPKPKKKAARSTPARFIKAAVERIEGICK